MINIVANTHPTNEANNTFATPMNTFIKDNSTSLTASTTFIIQPTKHTRPPIYNQLNTPPTIIDISNYFFHLIFLISIFAFSCISVSSSESQIKYSKYIHFDVK